MVDDERSIRETIRRMESERQERQMERSMAEDRIREMERRERSLAEDRRRVLAQEALIDRIGGGSGVISHDFAQTALQNSIEWINSAADGTTYRAPAEFWTFSADGASINIAPEQDKLYAICENGHKRQIYDKSFYFRRCDQCNGFLRAGKALEIFESEIQNINSQDAQQTTKEKK